MSRVIQFFNFFIFISAIAFYSCKSVSTEESLVKDVTKQNVKSLNSFHGNICKHSYWQNDKTGNDFFDIDTTTCAFKSGINDFQCEVQYFKNDVVFITLKVLIPENKRTIRTWDYLQIRQAAYSDAGGIIGQYLVGGAIKSDKSLVTEMESQCFNESAKIGNFEFSPSNPAALIIDKLDGQNSCTVTGYDGLPSVECPIKKNGIEYKCIASNFNEGEYLTIYLKSMSPEKEIASKKYTNNFVFSILSLGHDEFLLKQNLKQEMQKFCFQNLKPN